MFLETVLLYAFALFVTACVFFWYQNRYCAYHLRKIPGPKGQFLIGDAADILKSQEELFLLDRQRAVDFYPIARQFILNEAMVSVYSPEDIEIILNSMKHIAKSSLYDFLHPWLNTGLLTSEGTKWQTRRKILTPAFHFSILQEFINVFNEGTAKLVEDLTEKSLKDPVIDVIPPITEFTLLSIAETSMGIKLDLKSGNSRDYKKAVYDFGHLLTYRMVRPWLYPKPIFALSSAGRICRKLVSTLHGFSRKVIAERKKIAVKPGVSYSTRKRQAMLDLLLSAKMNGADIDDEGIREEVDTFMFEGHDTTSVAICFILMMLANHKKEQDEIRQEILEVLGSEEKSPTYADLQELKYTERCLKECLRLYPSVPFIARKASENIKTATGYIIPKGAMIHVHIFDTHRSPHVFPDPEVFNPDRFLPENIQTRHPFAFIPFSAGPRNCIGQKFAMLELKAVVCGILRAFVLEPIVKPEDIIFKTDLVLRSKNPIEIKFVPRKA